MQIRPATLNDARDIAELIDQSGYGLPRFLWGMGTGLGEDELEVGIQRVRREDAHFSYSNTRICADGGIVLGMCLAYRLPDQIEVNTGGDAAPWVRPLLALEAEVPGSWYINAVAAYPQFRGRGVGTALLNDSAVLAHRAECDVMSLIVESDNHSAKGLYEQLGFQDHTALPLVPWPDSDHEGDWVLMTRRTSHAT